VGREAIVGLSTHNAEQTEAGCGEPVSYLAIGPVFPTRSKPGDTNPVVGLEGVRRAAHLASVVGLPVVAIGGITLENAPRVLRAGASAVAVISDLLVGSPAERARRFVEALREKRIGRL
jgi:thiamine-phosphate pyrophosphorylase